MLYKWLSSIQCLLYPPTCLLCQAPGIRDLDICKACVTALPRIHHFCTRCALPLPSNSADVCGNCQQKLPYYDTALAPFHYTFPVDRLIQQLKFHGKLSNARLLGNLMADCLLQWRVDLPECIIPVPLHLRRLQARGFNQSLELGRFIGRRLNIPIDAQSVTRIKHTRPQMELPLKVRRRNVGGAFAASQSFHYQHVAVVDDVVTTGSTVNELARTLRRAGVKRIQVWSCARTA